LEKFEGIVSHLIANNHLTFTKDEIPSDGRGHNRALHISVKCMDYLIACVCINNGSSLNLMPKFTLDKLPSEVVYLRPSTIVVRAFDESRREALER